MDHLRKSLRLFLRYGLQCLVETGQKSCLPLRFTVALNYDLHVIRLKILSCSEKWINAARIPLHFLQGLPIYSFILQTLQSSNADDAGNFEAAVDALLAVLFNARHSEQQLLANSLPVILSLRKKWVRM